MVMNSGLRVCFDGMQWFSNHDFDMGHVCARCGQDDSKAGTNAADPIDMVDQKVSTSGALFLARVLDHGYVRVVDIMGDDASIVQAARVSYGRGTKTPSEDRSLIRYLMRHRHTTPFEMCEIKLHVKLPIFVARQWIRHRTANVNEYSGRYSEMPREFYVPEVDYIRHQSDANKQGSGNVHADAYGVRDGIAQISSNSFDYYQQLLDSGGARELCRIVLPLNSYTEWYWKTDLHNLFHFLKLRTDPHAQGEIQVYAKAIERFVEAWVPHAYGAWVDYVRDAVTLTRLDIEAIRQHVQSDKHLKEVVGMSDRELAEYKQKSAILFDEET